MSNVPPASVAAGLPFAAAPNNVLGPSFRFDDYVPKVNFEQLAKVAMDTDGSAVFWAGFGAVTLGFFIRVFIALYEKDKGKPFDYRTPITFAIFWILVGLGYASLSAGIIKFVTSLGLLDRSGDALTEVFARRYAGFMAHQQMHDTEWVPQMLTAEGWKVASLELLVHLSYVVVLAGVLILKGGQVIVLGIIVVMGPILLGAASIGPFFHVLALSWFWALTEVSMWSVGIGATLHLLDTFTRALPDHFSWVSEVMVSLLAVAGIWLATKYVAMLVRGDSAGSLGRDFGQAAYSMARLAQGSQSMAGKVAGPLGGAAAGNFGMGLATAGMAAFGRFMGHSIREAGAQMNQPHAPMGGGGAAAAEAPSSAGIANVGNGGGADLAASARRKQQNKHFAVKAKMGKRGRAPRGDV